jgi:hypothetical protein
MFELHLDMQFEDVRAILRLPKSGLLTLGVTRRGDPPGCNFAVAGTLLNLLAGCSRCLYNANPTVLTSPPPSGAAFKGLLATFFPWPPPGVAASTGANVLWVYARNPLSHALGLDVPKAPDIDIAKGALSERRILELENSAALPTWASPPLVKKASNSYVLDTAGFYWGLHRMLEAVLSDPIQLNGANSLAASLYF